MKKYYLLSGFLFILFSFCSCYNDDLLEEDPQRNTDKNDYADRGLNNDLCVQNWYKYDFPKPSFKVEQKNDFIWGINGHPMRKDWITGGYYSSYNALNINNQIDFLKELGLDIYRIDVHVDTLGITLGEDPVKFQNLLDLLEDNEMDMLPMLYTNPWRTGDAYIGNNWNYNTVMNYVNNNNPTGVNYIKNLDIWKYYYNWGKKTGDKFASNYGTQIKYYNIGNETGQYITLHYLDGLGGSSGANTSYFFSTQEGAKRTVASVAYTQGMIDGIKLKDYNSKIVINENQVYFGYLKFLKYMNVNYDIVGWNLYHDHFSDGNFHGYNIYNELLNINSTRPIWITEMNKNQGSYTPSPNSTEAFNLQAEKIRQYMQQMYNLPKVEAYLVYELIDGDYNYNSGNPQYEHYFGLITSPINNSWEYKPAYNTYRFTIEEFMNGYHDYFYSYYLKYTGQNRDLLSDSGIENWANNMRNGSNLSTSLDVILKEDCDYILNSWFNSYLERNIDLGARNYYYPKIKNENTSFEWVIADIISSPEFYQDAQSYYSTSTNYASNYIRYANMKLLGLTLMNVTEIQEMLSQYPNLTTDRNQRRDLAQNKLMTKTAYKSKIIKENFLTYLDRNILDEPIGYQYHIDNYQNHKTHIKTLLMSDEFWRKSVVRGYCYRQNNQP